MSQISLQKIIIDLQNWNLVRDVKFHIEEGSVPVNLFVSIFLVGFDIMVKYIKEKRETEAINE